MTSFIHTIGINFKSAELQRVACVQWAHPDQIAEFLSEVRGAFGIDEAFFLQTCNRREFYFYAPELKLEACDFRAAFLSRLAASLGESLDSNDFYHHRHTEATRHLFRVGASLDSMVLGETEIMKQLKDQSERGRKHGHVGRHLKALLETALWTSRQVRSKTEITKNVVSMASLIFRKISDRRAKRIVVVGAGHFIQSIMPTFAKEKGLEFTFVNRSLPTELATTYGGTAQRLVDFLADPQPFDAMITATGSTEILFSRQWLNDRGHRMLILDAALPRDVEDVADLNQVEYHDISQMEQFLTQNRAARAAEIPKAEPIFQEGLDKLHAAWLEIELSEYSRQISNHYQETGAKALTHLFKEHLSDLPDDQALIIRDWTQALVGKLTNIPILGLKGVAREIGEPAVDAFTRQIGSKSNLFRTEPAN